MEDYKYNAIVDWVRNYISDNNLKPDDRFLTEMELCNIHNVSRQTVRQALMKLESDNILKRVRGSGTFVSSGIRTPTAMTGTVGVISTYFSNYIFPHIITGIESVLNDAGCPIQIATTHNLGSEEAQAIRNMLNSNVSGFIIEPSRSALPSLNTGLYDEIRQRGIPLVFFNAKYEWSDAPYVAMDDIAAGKKAADHLFECGHKKLAGFFVFDNLQGHNRYRGFIESCFAHGETEAEKNVYWYAAGSGSKLFSHDKKRILEMLESSTAVVCYNDMLALELLKFCRKNEIKVPDDISIISIDDSKYAAICDVPLTSVHHPHTGLGEAAAKALLRYMDNPDSKQENILFTPELVVRKSVKQISGR
ncbi:MAG: GntR family transcriptional regulator [Oscillospiraceae bacterium]|nr:GntR family transcriptional regulator [Oscillospiraceae bacterium]